MPHKSKKMDYAPTPEHMPSKTKMSKMGMMLSAPYSKPTGKPAKKGKKGK